MPRPTSESPAYSLHKATGQARVRIAGRDIYLGKHDSPESLEKYHRLLAELHSSSTALPLPPEPPGQLSVAELMAHYVEHAENYYGRTNRDEKHRIKAAIGPLIELYASLSVAEFGPLKLQSVRQRLIERRNLRTEKPLSRGYVNQQIGVIKRIFKWGVAMELVPPMVYQALATVSNLRKGRAAGVKESCRVLPVPEEHIPPVIAVVSAEVGAMIQVQWLTGMRPDEVTIMRPCDIDCACDPWLYCIGSRFQGESVAAHGSKTDWREDVDAKHVFLGPKAQELLRPWLDGKADNAYLFDPRIAALRYNKAVRQKNGPRARYDDDSYRQAVTRGCRRAGVPVWTPNRLRHTAATTIERQFGIEAARLVLGHSNVATTAIYAERDADRYREIIAKIG